MAKETKCAICSQIAGLEEGDLIAHLLGGDQGYVRRVALESERFAVIPSVGPLTIGHVLLCPKQHYTSFARLPLEFLEEYTIMQSRLIELLNTAFEARVHIFEHGVDAQCSRTVCSVEHAHQHFIPANVDVWDALHDGIQWTSIPPSISALREAVRACLKSRCTLP